MLIFGVVYAREGNTVRDLGDLHVSIACDATVDDKALCNADCEWQSLQWQHQSWQHHLPELIRVPGFWGLKAARIHSLFFDQSHSFKSNYTC